MTQLAVLEGVAHYKYIIDNLTNEEQSLQDDVIHCGAATLTSLSLTDTCSSSMLW